MSTLTCIIVEDQPPAQRVLQKYIQDIGTLTLLNTFADPLEAQSFLNEEEVDLIFLDVHLPKISGIDFLKIMKRHPKVILTTAFSEYALEGYELEISDYLLKPFSFERFFKAVSKVIREKSGSERVGETVSQPSPSQQTDHLFVKSGNEYIQIKFAQLRYIKSDGDYTIAHTEKKKYLIGHPLRYWLQQLPANTFCQVHKSYIVNVQFVEKVSTNQIFIDELQIPIGRTFKEHFFTKYL